MEISKTYDPSESEDKWYKIWTDQGLFNSEPDDRESYTVVIPPPNVTGVLHMGHMLNNTIQDVLVRRARMFGKNACWVPGTDHASIATEAKVVQKLRAEGIKKGDLSREELRTSQGTSRQKLEEEKPQRNKSHRDHYHDHKEVVARLDDSILEERNYLAKKCRS